MSRRLRSALPGLKALLHLVDDIEPAFAPYKPIGAVARAQGFQGVPDLHLVASQKTTGFFEPARF
jgi:hypothetical protein